MPQPRKSAVVTLGFTVMVAGALTGCSSDAEVNEAGYCVDKQTQERVDDAECERDVHHHHTGWYYVRSGYRYPSIGQRATGGTFTRPTESSYVEGGLPRTGGVADAASAGRSGGAIHTVKTGGFGKLGGKVGS